MPWNTTLAFDLAPSRQADAYLAPEGERVPLKAGPNRFEIPAGRWLRLVGFSAGDLAAARAE